MEVLVMLLGAVIIFAVGLWAAKESKKKSS